MCPLKLPRTQALLVQATKASFTDLFFSGYSSYSRLLAYETSRILFRLGCDVRVYDPSGLPQKDDVQHSHPKVQELRELSKWSDGHVWVSPEQHGNLVSTHKWRWVGKNSA